VLVVAGNANGRPLRAGSAGGRGATDQLALLAAALFAPNNAIAQDREECFSKYTKYNVCEKAWEMQRTVAPSLPMKMTQLGLRLAAAHR
jgi:hypothetical protein